MWVIGVAALLIAVGGSTAWVRVFMVAIRKKLEPDPAHPRYFITEPGSGLRFVPEGDSPVSVEE